jgi:hemerythrin-like domain-containing protein
MNEVEALESRHEVIQKQLELIDGWVEHLPITNIDDRRGVMRQIVDFLQRYVLVDARWEEERFFPLLGERAETLKAEHGFITRWVKELESVAEAPALADAVRFRRTAYKLIGLLEAHMHVEEMQAEALAKRRRLQSPADIDGVPAELT